MYEVRVKRGHRSLVIIGADQPLLRLTSNASRLPTSTCPYRLTCLKFRREEQSEKTKRRRIERRRRKRKRRRRTEKEIHRAREREQKRASEKREIEYIHKQRKYKHARSVSLGRYIYRE